MPVNNHKISSKKKARGAEKHEMNETNGNLGRLGLNPIVNVGLKPHLANWRVKMDVQQTFVLFNINTYRVISCAWLDIEHGDYKCQAKAISLFLRRSSGRILNLGAITRSGPWKTLLPSPLPACDSWQNFISHLFPMGISTLDSDKIGHSYTLQRIL